jgi:hypothetical protein
VSDTEHAVTPPNKERHPVKKTPFVVVALALSVTTPALAADDPVASAKADLATLLADAQAKHDTLIADANKLKADVAAASAAKDRKALKTTLRADLQQLRSDRQAAIALLQADRDRLKADLEAVRQARAGRGSDLRSLLEQARATLAQEREETQAAMQAARQAEQAALAAFKK